MNQSDKDFVVAVTTWRKQDTKAQKQINNMRRAYKQRLITMTNAEVDEVFK